MRQLIGNHFSILKQLLAVAGSRGPLVGRWYSLTPGRVPATSEFFTRVLASRRDPLPSWPKPGPSPPENAHDRLRLDWDPSSATHTAVL